MYSDVKTGGRETTSSSPENYGCSHKELRAIALEFPVGVEGGSGCGCV